MRNSHPNLRIVWPKGNTLTKSSLAVVDVDITLTTVTIRHNQINKAIAIHVCRSDSGRRLMREGEAVGIKLSFTFVKAHVIRPFTVFSAVRHKDVRQPIAVYISNSGIACGPFGTPKGRQDTKISFAIVCIDAFRIWRIVTDNNIQVSIAIDVSESHGVRPIRDITKVVCFWKTPMSIIKQHSVD